MAETMPISFRAAELPASASVASAPAKSPLARAASSASLATLAIVPPRVRCDFLQQNGFGFLADKIVRHELEVARCLALRIAAFKGRLGKLPLRRNQSKIAAQESFQRLIGFAQRRSKALDRRQPVPRKQNAHRGQDR